MSNFSTLLIEDDLMWLRKLEAMFSQLNLGPFRSATTLAEARQLMAEQLPDLVIADIVLPDGLSFELFRAPYQHLPVIFQTAYANDEFLRKAIARLTPGFLLKPFDGFALQVAVVLIQARLPTRPLAVDTSRGLSVIGNHGEQLTIGFDAIYWIKGEGNYSILYTQERKYALKRSLRQLLQELPPNFVQAQKAYIINRNYVEGVMGSALQIKQERITIGRVYKKQVLSSMASRGK